MEAIPQEVVACHDKHGNVPFDDWLSGLDPKTMAVVINRVDRLERGSFGDVRSVGDGVSELRIDYGPGYRVYIGRIGNIVHLIRGGNKDSQEADIKDAKKFWNRHEDEDDIV